jgi:hypothetical protein
MIRLLNTVILCALLGACAGRTRDCTALAGPGWKLLPGPPPDSRELLIRANLARDSDLIWLGQSEDKVMICDHSSSLINPSCGGSRAYPFERVNGKWVAGGLLLDVCNTSR